MVGGTMLPSSTDKSPQDKEHNTNELLKKQKLDEELAAKEIEAYIGKLKSSLELIRVQIKTKSGVQDEQAPGTFCHLLLSNIDELEKQLIQEAKAGNYDYAKNTIALLENAVTAVYTPGISAWKVDYAISRFQNEARKSIFSNETKAKITKVAVCLSFGILVAGMALGVVFAPIPTAIAVITVLIASWVFRDRFDNMLRNVTKANPYENYGNDLGKNLKKFFNNPTAKPEIPATKPELEETASLLPVSGK